MGIEDISFWNKGWGICGFASALGALYEAGIVKGAIDATSKTDLGTRLLAEVKTYLVILQSKNENSLLKEITRFTKLWNAAFTIESYIAKINTIASTPPKQYDKGLTLAMPPSAVLDYLKRIGDKKNARIEINSKVSFDNVVLGLCDPNLSNEWNGLRHWVYKKSNSEIYNYGNKIKWGQLPSDRKVVYQIIIG